ncbi:Heterokaryon incompatibility [Niveomyces insectorum RCEF 264]|uniref:Heterokaryon incompatibility n=1 Tax=Niveomyces insectorum RCEF 264 TaxID=1081102 RepID=A0A167NQ43_9HYPO|nr:Heterokaryon incompatibility [Niveomyces insectorum RCEF 264]
MIAYQYAPLLDPGTDIRLIKLLPGRVDDDLVAEIVHAALVKPPQRKLERWSLDKVQSTVPPDWMVYETVEGRYLFSNPEEETFWEHPDASVNRANYDALPDEVDHGFKPEYEALSYTWGTAIGQHILWLESDQSMNASSTAKSSPRPRHLLRIHENLAEALRSLRYEDASRTLWVDAVCINQTDIPERNKQVTRMADIYRLAHRVVAWLGPATNRSSVGLATLDQLGSQAEFTKQRLLLNTPGTTQKELHFPETVLPFAEATWRGVLDVIARPWFDRLWVIQEIQLANRRAILCCGGAQATISWPHLRNAIFSLYVKVQPMLPAVRQRCNTLCSFAEHIVGEPLMGALLYTRGRLCRDPRDKIYALMGLLPDHEASAIRPDYAAPVADVYRDATLLSLANTRRLSFLYCGSSGGSGGPALPSWVPDWSVAERAGQDVELGYCSGSSRACATFEPPGTLQVWGVPCGTVQAVSRPMPATADATTLRAARDFFVDYTATSPAHNYPTGESLVEALALTLLMDRYRERYPSAGPRYPFWGEWVQQVDDYISGRKASYADEQDMATTIAIIVRQQEVFFSTDKGHLGATAAVEIRQGDKLFAVLGSLGMIILRPTPDGTYKVVGASYVHGFADAEALLGPLATPWRVECAYNAGGQWSPSFVNDATGQTTDIDPRFGPLPPDWECLAEVPRAADDPPVNARFRNKDTGMLANADPRLQPEVLEARGVDLQEIKLV